MYNSQSNQKYSGYAMELCEGCGAVVGDREMHDAWHARIERVVGAVAVLAPGSVPLGAVWGH